MHRGKGMKFVGDSRIPAEKKPNIPKDYSEYPGKTEAFWPNFLLKEWMVGAVFLIGFLVLTIVHQPPLERMADPTDTGYIPLPDWYFLFLYQLLKYEYAAGSFTVVGAMIMPGLAFGALLLAPFLDRGTEKAVEASCCCWYDAFGDFRCCIFDVAVSCYSRLGQGRRTGKNHKRSRH